MRCNMHRDAITALKTALDYAYQNHADLYSMAEYGPRDEILYIIDPTKEQVDEANKAIADLETCLVLLGDVSHQVYNGTYGPQKPTWQELEIAEMYAEYDTPF